MPMNVLLGKPPRMHRSVQREVAAPAGLRDRRTRDRTCALDVLRHPTVASKSFLVTIGDRTVGGMNSRDPMVGPWQVPVADCAVTMMSFEGYAGEAMAIGERTPARGHRRGGRVAHGNRRVDHEHRCGRRRTGRRKAVVQLDGCVRRAGRGRAPVRRSACCERTVPGVGNQRAGRQGFIVDEDRLARRRRRARRQCAGLADRERGRRGRRRAALADAATRRRRRTRCSCWSTWAPDATAWAGRSSRR